jgi:uncharacterized Ntn-hydrolase superfamily protein
VSCGQPYKATFSICALDAPTGEIGVAVQSKYFAVGNVVPWAKAGVGAVATQAAGVAAFGRRGLDELRDGAGAPDEALRRVLAGDAGRGTRQVGIVAADGRSAAWTGSECQPWAGHRTGPGYAVQGNILAGEAVVTEMERAWLETSGAFGHRLVTALEAGQAAGGDSRGQQSAALVVERGGAAAESREGIDRVCDLRVEDHETPIAELRRLYGIWERWEAMHASSHAAQSGDVAAASRHAERALELDPNDPMLAYNLACYRALSGQSEEALELLRRSLPHDESLRVQARTDPDLESLRDREEYRELVG